MDLRLTDEQKMVRSTISKIEENKLSPETNDVL